jgi:hypothetical protein
VISTLVLLVVVAQGICSAVTAALQLSQQEMEVLGARARQDYELGRREFVRRMEEVGQLVKELLEQRRQGLHAAANY